MTAGVKQTVKGFLNPPQTVHTVVRDAETGVPIAATIVVGQQFSWAYQAVTLQTSPSFALKTDGATLTTPFGPVNFTVIPDDNVAYHTQNFPKINIIKSSQDQTLTDFKLESNRNRINVCVSDAVTKESISGFVTFEDLPTGVNPIPGGYVVTKGNCKVFSFASNIMYYHVKVTADGYAPLVKTVMNNTSEGYAQGVGFELTRAMTIRGTVTVNGKRVAGAKVYVKELTGQPAVYADASGNYAMNSLPVSNQPVTLIALDTAMNAIGKEKTITLNMTPDPSENSQNNQNNQNSNSKSPSLGYGISAQPTPVYGTVPTYYMTQGEVNKTLNLKNVDFDLNGNSNYDLSNLYGFPLEVESLDGFGENLFITGRIKVPANNIFNITHQPYLHFTHIKIQPPGQLRQGQKSGDVKIAIKPVTALVKVDDDNVDIAVYGKYGAQLMGFNNGIQIASGGLVGGTVALTGVNIARNVQLVSELTLKPMDTKPVMGKPLPEAIAYSHYNAVINPMNVFTANPANAGNVISPYYTFLSSNGYGSSTGVVHYNLNNMYYTHANGYLYADGLHLFSIIHTSLQNVATPDIAQYVGEVKVSDQLMKPLASTDSTQISIPIDDWSIKSNSWNIYSGALTMNGNVFAGNITVPFNGMQVNESSVDFGNLQLNKIGIAGVKTLDIIPDSTSTSFGYDKAAEYGTQYNKHYGCWSLSMLPKHAGSILTKVSDLPDLAAADRVNIMNISLYSKGGESLIELQQNHPVLTLNSFASFAPAEIESGQDYLKINGALNFTIPGLTGTENTPYSLNYTASGGTLIHKHEPIAGLKLTTNGIRVDFDTDGQVFTGNKLGLKGILQDKVANSPYAFHVNFGKGPYLTSLVVNNAAKDVISMGGDQQMSNINGSMYVNAQTQTWNNFVFDGDITATGMSATEASHMNFTVQGDLVASKAKIGMQNMTLPGGIKNFNLTYDFKQKAIVGSLHIDSLKTPMATASADLEMQFGGGGWYILGAAVITDMNLPLPFNGGSAAFLVGNTDIKPEMMQRIQPVFHNGEMPKNFGQKFPRLKGSLFVVGVDMKLPIVPDIDLDLAIASLHIHYGVYANAYFGVSFAGGPKDATIIGGVKVGAYVNISAGASLGLVCAGISLAADVNAEADITMSNLDFTILNPVAFYKNSYLNVDLSTTATFTGEAYVGAGICNSSCNAVKVFGVKIPPGCFKKSISGSMSLGLDFNITKGIGSYVPTAVSASANLFGTTYTFPK